jgi:hypothetical protein
MGYRDGQLANEQVGDKANHREKDQDTPDEALPAGQISPPHIPINIGDCGRPSGYHN